MSSKHTISTKQGSTAAHPGWLAGVWQKARLRARWAGSRAAWPCWSVLFALLAGAALRLLFILRYPEFDSDSEVYGTIARNLLLHHAYALDGPFRPTLVRLPGYPLFLAAIFSVFGIGKYAPVRPIQMVIDLASCLLVAGFVRDHASRRAARWALWLAALCPFTANLTAVPLTETDSIFCVALGLFAVGRLIGRLRPHGRLPWGYLALTAFALSSAILLRPDGFLLSAAILPCIWWYRRGDAARASIRAALVCALLAFLPLIPWTIRNYRVFHLFQPLAPRYANDPGEDPFPGWVRWTKTWLVEYVSSPEVYWRGDDLTIDIHMLPRRAFDSPEEYRQTEKLLFDYNDLCSFNPELDARFAALAEQRIDRHPLRYYLVLPLARLADMWLRPRTEYLWDAVPIRWWEWHQHPAGSLFAIAYGLLDATQLALAAFGFLRRRVPFAAMLATYVLLRCLLLATMENAEPRYTLEAFPIVLIAAALALAAPQKMGSETR